LTVEHRRVISGCISAVVFALSLIPDFTSIPTVPGSTGEQTALLMQMHAVAAAVEQPEIWKLTEW
jgi:hypothetical protein